MSRFTIIAVFLVAVALALAVSIVSEPARVSDADPAPRATPPQFDTTSGQEMRPRWPDPEGEGDDATND